MSRRLSPEHQACDELRPYLRREFGWPLTELGRIRLRRGDIQGAEEAFRAAHAVGWDPEPGLALVHLARGDFSLAVTSIRDALANAVYVPSKELPPHTELRRAPLLEAQVEIELKAGDLAFARAAADDLSRVAATFGSKALAAGAALANGRVALAEGDVASARRDFEHAARLWSEIGAPYETALAQMGLAHVYRATGNETRALLEFEASGGTFERVGAVTQAAEAARARVHPGPDAGARSDRRAEARPATNARDAGTGVFRREGDYWSVAFEGTVVRVRDVKGLRYLARLLANPGRELHVLDLVADERDGAIATTPLAENDRAVSSGMDAGALLDARAKAAYRRRLTEIDEDIEEARVLSDDERGAQAQAERDFLIRELARAVGLGGRDRRAGSSSERARASVTRAVRKAMERIGEHHRGLGEHLGRTIRTGTHCAYVPDARAPTTWKP